MAGSKFKQLIAWKKARRLVPAVYHFVSRFPVEETFVLNLQMRKAAQSVHLNIAEGHGRLSNGEWQQFLGQSRGSLHELESAVVSAFDLRYCSAEEAAHLSREIQEVIRLINGLLRRSAQGHARKKFKPPDK
jgi:four helix bundle protein